MYLDQKTFYFREKKHFQQSEFFLKN